MNNKDKIFLASLQETLKEFVNADIGKAAKADLKATVTAAGGAKKLAEADKVLEVAHAERDKIVGLANREAASQLLATEQVLNTQKAALDERERVIDGRMSGANTLRDSLALKSQQLENAVAAVKAREDAAVVRDGALDMRESQVASREASATSREADILAFDNWRATAP